MLQKNGWNVWYTAPDALGDWWHARAGCDIKNINQNVFIINNTTGQKISVVLPIITDNVAVDGVEVDTTQKCVGNRNLSIILLDTGKHKITFTKKV